MHNRVGDELTHDQANVTVEMSKAVLKKGEPRSHALERAMSSLVRTAFRSPIGQVPTSAWERR